MRSLRDRREDTDRQTRIKGPQDLTSEAGITEPKRVTVSFDLIAMDVHDLVPSQKLRIHRPLRQRTQRWTVLFIHLCQHRLKLLLPPESLSWCYDETFPICFVVEWSVCLDLQEIEDSPI